MTRNPKPEAEVIHTGAPGRRRQWGKWPFYRLDGAKWTAVPKVFLVTVILFFVSGSVASLIFSGDAPLPVRVTIHADMLASSDGPHVAIPPAIEHSTSEKRPKVGRPEKKAPLGHLQMVKRKDSGVIPPGSMFKARLISGASNGPLRAVAIQPLTVNGETLIETGTVLLGSGQSTEERLMVHFSQIVFKDGSFMDFQAQALDPSDQTVGLKGSKVGGYAAKLAAAAALNFAAGLSDGLQNTAVVGGVGVRPPTMHDALLNGSATAALEQGQNLLNSAKDTPVIIEVPPGVEFFVLTGQGG